MNFDEIEKLLEIKKTGDHEYSKMTITGKCSLFDYNKGVIHISIKPVVSWLRQKVNNPLCYQARVCYSTVDDGTYGGWSKYMTKEDAEALCDKLADYYKDITVLPSDERVNKDLVYFGMYLTNE